MSSAAEIPPPSSTTRWLILIVPILLLLPLALLPDAEGYVPAWIRNTAGVFCLAAMFFGPFALLIAPFIAILSIAFVYESIRDWLARGRTGGSLAVAVLWMGPTLLYGTLSLWPLLLVCT